MYLNIKPKTTNTTALANSSLIGAIKKEVNGLPKRFTKGVFTFMAIEVAPIAPQRKEQNIAHLFSFSSLSKIKKKDSNTGIGKAAKRIGKMGKELPGAITKKDMIATMYDNKNKKNICFNMCLRLNHMRQ